MPDPQPTLPRADELIALVERCPWLVEVLRVVAATERTAWVGAGVVRDVVWDTRFARGFDPASVKDVDVAYFDDRDLSRQRDRQLEEELSRRRPDVEWDAKNQAAVHTWYPARFGVDVDPLPSVPDAVATWPETAVAVAVRLRDDVLEIAAPLGLDDLLDGVWRRNPRRVTVDEYRRRLARKRPEARWPGVRVVAE